MDFNSEKALEFKKILEDNTFVHIVKYAQRSYPNECCGFILENGTVFPAHNVIGSLREPTLTNKTAFLIDSVSFQLASSNKSPIVCIYHSHTNGDPNISQMDKSFLRWTSLCYLIIGLFDTNHTSSKLFWWEGQNLRELDIQL